MVRSKIINELKKKPRAEIEADLARITAGREEMQAEENFLRAVLSLVDVDGSPQDSGGDTAERNMTAREHILAVVRGYEPWTIQGVIAAVQERNPDAKAPAIRLALRRLEQDEVLMRDQHKNYRRVPTGPP